MRRAMKLVLFGVVGAAAVGLFHSPGAAAVTFPDGKRFAFTIIDDTDMAMLERLRPVYGILEKYGLRTTKTVWVMASNDQSNPANRGESLSNPAYREFVTDLNRKGFEIALHGVRGGSSRRQESIAGLEDFRTVVGGYPRMHINHSLNRDNLYWGKHLYAYRPLQWAGGLFIRHDFDGEDPDSEYFWGDLARERIQYVRRFTYPEINLLKLVPAMPYRLRDKPYVNYWFPTANGGRVIEFDRLLQPENLDRLEREGGVCLVYAHLGSGSFNKGAGVDPRFEARIKDLASRNGWFAPASDILDHLRRQPSWTGDMGVKATLWLDMKFIAGQFGLD